jgi:hypothetical protein
MATARDPWDSVDRRGCTPNWSVRTRRPPRPSGPRRREDVIPRAWLALPVSEVDVLLVVRRPVVGDRVVPRPDSGQKYAPYGAAVDVHAATLAHAARDRNLRPPGRRAVLLRHVPMRPARALPAVTVERMSCPSGAWTGARSSLGASVAA